MQIPATLPGVRANAIRQTRLSAKQWILLVKPPRERPIAWIWVPFIAGWRAVCLHVGGIEHQLLGVRTCGNDLGKQVLLDTAMRPSVVSVVDRRVSAVS
jgi:hypothetical protein